MASGGARARSGPPPDPSALNRERDQGDWVLLPAGGRGRKAAPKFPLLSPMRREVTIWARLWKLPQAVMWERQSQEFEVALYVRRLVEAETLDSSVNRTTVVRQMGDSLGLTTPGLRANRWKIIFDEVTPRREAAAARPAPRAARASSRSRLKVIKNAPGG